MANKFQDSQLASKIAEMPTDQLLEVALDVDKDGEVTVGEDNLMLVQMEISDRIKTKSKEYVPTSLIFL